MISSTPGATRYYVRIDTNYNNVVSQSLRGRDLAPARMTPRRTDAIVFVSGLFVIPSDLTARLDSTAPRRPRTYTSIGDDVVSWQ